MRDYSESEKGNTKRQRFDWLTILVTALVTGAITIVTGMILFRWQASEPHLVYSTIETLPFTGQNQVIGIYQVTISNDGNKSVEEVTCHIRVAGANIEQKRISTPPSLTYSESAGGDNLKLQIPSINPSENVQVSFLAVAPSNLPTRPEISLRANGVSGVEKAAKDGEKKPSWITIVSAILGIIGGSGVLYLRLFEFDKGDNVKEGKHFDDQRRILAYLCTIHGLAEEADRYLSNIPEASYWAEADRLATIAIANNSEKTQHIKDVLEDLLEYAEISKSSRGLIFYNLARIASATGDLANITEYLNKAKSLEPTLVEARLKIDPILQQHTRASS